MVRVVHVVTACRVERDTVIGCSNELEHAAATGQRITLVAACVTTRLCPNATEEVPSPPQPSYCPDYKAKIRDTIQNATRPEATYEEAAAAADVWAREGIDALVARVPEVYRHNKQLYDDGHETVRRRRCAGVPPKRLQALVGRLFAAVKRCQWSSGWLPWGSGASGFPCNASMNFRSLSGSGKRSGGLGWGGARVWL